MGCKPSKELDQVAKDNTLCKKQSQLSRKETTKALDSHPTMPNESKDDLIPDMPEEVLPMPEKAEEDPVPNKPEEGSTHDEENEEEIVLDNVSSVEEVVEEIEEEEKEKEEEREEVVIEANDEEEGEELGLKNVVEIESSSNVVDSPDSYFSSTKDDEVVERAKLVEGLDVVEEEGVEVDVEMEKLEEGCSSNSKDSADLKEMILMEKKEPEAVMEEKMNVSEGVE